MVLPNLRNVRVFQWLVRWLTWCLDRPGGKLEERMSICSSTPQDHGGYTSSGWLESDLKVRKCDAMLFFENFYEPKMDVILTISFKIAGETCFASFFRIRIVSALYGTCSFIAMNFFLLSIARFFPCQWLENLWAAFADGSSMEKTLNSGLMARWNRVKPIVLGSNPASCPLFFLFCLYFFLVFPLFCFVYLFALLLLFFKIYT